MAQVSITFPKKDVDNLMRAMERQSRSLGIPMREATQNAAKLVAYSAAAATIESKAYRQYKQRKEKSSSGLKRYSVKNDRTGKRISVFAKNVRELKKDSRVRIARRGLAKVTWKIIGAQIGGSSEVQAGKDNASPQTAQQARKFGDVKIDNNIFNPSVTMTNSLKYAGAAIKGGEAELGNIVGKAARRMHMLINNAVKSKLKAA
jgi:hypothetical protein